MDRTRHARISQLFGHVCDLPPEERAVRLREACADDPTLVADVERLLEAEAKAVLQVPALGPGFGPTVAAWPLADDGPATPRRLGPYRVRRCISSGGMAVVYEAEQERPQRVVALKVLRGGLLSQSALKRFHLEAEVLGRLQHPGIARIYDAGLHRDSTSPESDPGVPYIAMEMIDGLPITDYARAHGLDARARMELLAKVCDAVQHAHQHGIIHRDLKPANILVDGSGQPRVLDFGIARARGVDLSATAVQTEAGQLLGTLPYMSPEQVLGDPNAVDARSDVHALGILFYELLSGRLPYPVLEAAIPEAARIIREDEPAPLSSVVPSLRGDPTIIAAKALEKDRQRRYQSAAQLAADIRHFLADEPILARPASTMYQLGKMASRHKAVFAALAVAVLALAAATLVSARMAIVAGRAEDRAVAALRESEASSGYLLDLFLPNPDQSMLSRQELLELAERRMIDEPLQDARVEAKLREYIGHGWHKLNYLENAEPHLVRALELRRSLGARDEDLAKCLLLVAMQRFTQGRVEDGERALREVLAVRRELFGPDHWAGADQGELMYWVLSYTPDEPEALAELGRRTHLREQRPIARAERLQAPSVLDEEFDGESLAPAWRLALLNATAWTHALADSRLTVSDIRADVRHDTRNGALQRSTPASARLSRNLAHALGDFRVEARIGWDSEGRPEALQYASVLLHGPGRLTIASVQYGDDWLQFRGARKACIGRTGVSQHVMNSGRDTLPDQGTAELAIERLGERVTVSWDGHVLMYGFSSDPLVEVGIDFLWTVHESVEGRSSFGREWIDSIRVVGTEPGSTPPLSSARR